MSVDLSVCLPAYRPISVCLLIFWKVYMTRSVCQFVDPCIYLSMYYLSLSLHIIVYLFMHLLVDVTVDLSVCHSAHIYVYWYLYMASV